jgi:hypothetical protein
MNLTPIEHTFSCTLCPSRIAQVSTNEFHSHNGLLYHLVHYRTMQLPYCSLPTGMRALIEKGEWWFGYNHSKHVLHGEPQIWQQ